MSLNLKLVKISFQRALHELFENNVISVVKLLSFPMETSYTVQKSGLVCFLTLFGLALAPQK